MSSSGPRLALQDIVDEASRVLGADTVVEDTHLNLVAYGNQRFDVDAVRQSSILQRGSSQAVRAWFEQFGVATSAVPLRTPADADQGLRARLCFPARWRGVTYGYLWALDDHTALDDPVVERVSQLAEHAAAHLAQLRRQSLDDASAVSDLLSTDTMVVEQAALRIGDRGQRERASGFAAVWVGAQHGEVPSGTVPNLWSLPRTVLVDRGTDATTLLVPVVISGTQSGVATPQQLAAQVVARWCAELPSGWDGRLVAGVGGPRTDLAHVRESWREARLAAEVAASVPALGPVATWEGLGLYRLLAVAPRRQLAAVVLDGPVRRLLEVADPDLRRTAEVYLERAGSARDTAAALHIHRQTLYYRLAKIESLTGLRLGDGDDRLRLHLGLLLAPVLDDSA